MTPEAIKRAEAAGPELLAGCLVLLAVLDDPAADREAARRQAEAAVRKAQVGPLAAKMLHRQRTVAGLEQAKAQGRRLGRPRFVLTPGKRAILDIWRAGDPRDPLRVLAKMLGCSIGKASEIARSEG